MRKFEPFEVNDRIKEQFNLKAVQKPRGFYPSIEIKVKNKISEKKFLGIIIYFKHEFKTEEIYFNDTYTLTNYNIYGRVIQRSRITVALDFKNEIAYWKYVD